ncbi:MAG: MBL fold metallo-hydrolase [Candidatus Woykebacteria bacterium]
MKIKFLGTSAGWPLPRLGCSDKICTSRDPRDKRTRSQALINDRLLLDIGPDTYLHLNTAGVNPTAVEYAAITHEHPDHTFGLWDLGHIYNGKKIKVIIHPSTFQKIKKLFFYKEYEILKTEAATPVVLDDLQVSLLPVNHTDSSFGIFVKGKGRSFFWAPDFKTLPPQTKAKIKGTTIAIDGSELRIPTQNHQTIIEGVSLGRVSLAKSTYFIHIGHRNLPHKELVRFVQKTGGKNFNVAFDGLEVEI